MPTHIKEKARRITRRAYPLLCYIYYTINDTISQYFLHYITNICLCQVFRSKNLLHSTSCLSRSRRSFFAFISANLASLFAISHAN